MTYPGQINLENRWIKVVEMLPWEELEAAYRKYFDRSKPSVIKKGQWISGLFLEHQIIVKMRDRNIMGYFQLPSIFSTFVAKIHLHLKQMRHPRWLSKQRNRPGIDYMKFFETEVTKVLCRHGVIRGKPFQLDTPVFEASRTSMT